jgi:hypothetical protein
MNGILWTLQILLGILFLFSGLMKSTMSEQWLVKHGQTGVGGLPALLIKFIGITEVAGAFGLVLPWWLNIAPVLSPLSAVGFCIIMVLAAEKHYTLREPKNVLTNIVVFLLSAFVAYGRFKSLSN